MALDYDMFLKLRDGKLSQKEADEMGLSNYKEGVGYSPVGSLHNAEFGGSIREQMSYIPYGVNDTADNR